MNFVDELRWRGMVHDMTPGLEEVLTKKKVSAYIGFDPTAPSLTIGNYVQVMLLTLLQKHGHRPVVLMGGATGRIGDPSGKDAERSLKSYEELDANLAHQEEQFRRFLVFDGENGAQVINNLDFYKDMNVLTFLRTVGKTLTVNYMTSKESVKRRLDSGLSFTEFSYQLLQAFDFQQLYQQYDCSLQLGGSDQWGNITSGTEFIRRNLGKKAYALTTPLLTKSDGSKFGKSESGNIWLDPKLTTPYQFYQFWINADDADMPTYLRYFSLKEHNEIEAMEAEMNNDPRAVKRALAEELTRRVHADYNFDAVLAVSELLFNNKANAETLRSLPLDALQEVAREIPSFDLSVNLLESELPIADLLAEHTSILSSKSEVRKAVKNNAISINKIKVASWDHPVSKVDLLHEQYIMLENGKRNKFLLRFTTG